MQASCLGPSLLGHAFSLRTMTRVRITSSAEEGWGGDLTTLREHNLTRVLDALLLRPEGLRQIEIAEQTNLSRTTVSTLLGELAEVLILEGEPEINRGRPPKRWRVNPTYAYAIGVDVGRTQIRAAATDSFGALVSEPITQRVARIFDRPHQLIATAAALVERLIDEADIPCARIAAVTIGLPGAVDAARGVMTDDAARPWAGLDVRDEVRKRWPHDVVPELLADNDANLAALAEHRFGAGQAVDSSMFVKWSTGIGSGLVLDNALWRGHAGVAGEIGHLCVRPTKQEASSLRLPQAAARPECPDCHQADCLELVASGRVVAAAVGLEDLSAVARAALDGSSPKSDAARKALKAAATLIGRAIGLALTILNVERVIVGGMVGRELYSLLAEDFSRGIAATALPAARANMSLAMGTLNGIAPVWGAALAGFDQHGIDFLLAAAERAAKSAKPLAASA
jgi:predicted NBD/HSP70 family sugar kinase